MNGRYYIRVRGRRQGPLTVEQLHSLARRGRFGRHYEVSTDGKSWKSAADFPELFARAAETEDEAIEGFSEDEYDIGGANSNPPPAPEKRRRPSARSQDDDFTPPPAIDFDDLYSTGSDQSERRRPSRGRPSSGGPRHSIPLAGDSPDDYDDDEVALPEPPSMRRRGPERTVAPATAPIDDLDIPVWEPIEKAPRVSNQRRKEVPKKTEKPTARTRKPDPADEEPEPAEPVEEKKSRGFFGFLFGKSNEEEDLPEHLRELRERSSRLAQLSFGLDKIVLIGGKGRNFRLLVIPIRATAFRLSACSS